MGRRKQYTDEMVAEAVRANVSIAGVLRDLGMKLAGGNYQNINNRIKDLGLDTSHFTGQGHWRGRNAGNRKSAEELLVVLPPGSHRIKIQRLRRAMFESGVEERCCGCGLGSEWNGTRLQLEVDHINEEWLDNRLENLQFLCPNCHSQKTASTRGGTVDTPS